MMNTQAMGSIVSKVAPGVDKWFPDLPELEAIFPDGTIGHSVEPIYPEVGFSTEFVRSGGVHPYSIVHCSTAAPSKAIQFSGCRYLSGKNPSWRREADMQVSSRLLLTNILMKTYS